MDDPHNRMPSWYGKFRPLDLGPTPVGIINTIPGMESIVPMPVDPEAQEILRRGREEVWRLLREQEMAPVYDALRQGQKQAKQNPSPPGALDTRTREEEGMQSGLTLPQLCERMNAEEAGSCTMDNIKPTDGTPAVTEPRKR